MAPCKASISDTCMEKSLVADVVLLVLHKSWGELSGYRKELSKRNKAIIEKYQNGLSIEELADEYHLSVYAIRKIVYQK